MCKENCSCGGNCSCVGDSKCSCKHDEMTIESIIKENYEGEEMEKLLKMCAEGGFDDFKQDLEMPQPLEKTYEFLFHATTGEWFMSSFSSDDIEELSDQFDIDRKSVV